MRKERKLMKRIWITGAEGHTGSALSELLDTRKYHLFLTDIEDVDITNLNEVEAFARLNRPDVIINCASLTDVEECAANPDRAYQVNAIGVRNIAQAANVINAKVIHLSTDDVFDLESETPYNEFDPIHPKTIYGKSKAAGETMLTQLTNRFVIIRSSWIYGIGKDFVNTVLTAARQGGTLEVPNNRYAAPTSAKEVAKAITYFIEHDDVGLYHIVCPSGCSRYDFARTILEYSGNTGKVDLVPVISDNSRRPSYSILDNMMLRLTGIPEPKEWHIALKEYLDETGGLE